MTKKIKMNFLDWIALILVLIGGINWGLIGFLGFNLVDFLSMNNFLIKTIIYDMVGVASVYSIVRLIWLNSQR